MTNKEVVKQKMSKILEKYLEYQEEWSKLACEGKEGEYEKLVKQAHDELYPKFSKEDWEELIKITPNIQAKIAWTKEKEKLFG